MARISINLELGDLEPNDTIEGYKAINLVRFAMIVNRAGITDDKLKEFCHDCDRIAETIRADIEHTMHQALIDSIPGALKGSIDNGKN